MPWSLILLGLLLAGCKDPALVAADAKVKTVSDLVTQGRVALADENFEQAISFFKQASNSAPEDPTLFLLLARAHKLGGNDGAAVLAIKQAEDLGARNDPAVKRERAELYRRMGHLEQAIATLLELRESNQLTDEETLLLARLQAHQGDVEAGYQTLERIQKLRPDNPEVKVVEAELLLIAGEEVLATKLIDRLLAAHPGLVSARVLRGRYFIQNGHAEVALKDLERAAEDPSKETQLVELRALALNSLQRYPQAADILRPVVESNPRDAHLITQLAETELYLGNVDQAQLLVDRALSIRPAFARALYVRGRALEGQGDLEGAADQYQYALRSDPSLGPALSRIWPVYLSRGEKGEALGALQRLSFINEATIDEKIALATLYLDTGSHTERAKKLIAEAARVQPNHPRVKALKARLAKAASNAGKGGVTIIRFKGR